MSAYDATNIGALKWDSPPRQQLLLERPVKSWSAEDWTYVVYWTDDCWQSRVRVMELLREAFPELGERFKYVLEVWEAGYFPGGSKRSGE